MELKPGYKLTDGGAIPEDWDVALLKTLAEKIMVGIASAATHAYRTKGVTLLRNQNIKLGYLDDDDILFVDPGYELSFKNKRLKAGDLLTARTGYPGTTCVVPPKYESAQSFTTLITRLKTNAIDSVFACHYINSERGQSFFTQNQIGGGQKNVNAGSLRQMPIPIPPPAEQQAIAGALSDVDALIGALDQLIAKKRDLKQAAMQQLLTGHQRLPGFAAANPRFQQTEAGLIPDDWEATVLKGKIGIAHGFAFESQFFTTIGRYRLTTPGHFYEDGGFRDIGDKQKYYEGPVPDGYVLRLGDLIVAMTEQADGLLGSAALIPQADCYLHNQRLGRVVVGSSQIDRHFLYYIFNASRFRSKVRETAAGTKVKHTSPQKLLDIAVPLPSPAEQTVIAEVLSDMDAELAALEQKRDKTRLLKQGMMQELLTGRTRLI